MFYFFSIPLLSNIRGYKLTNMCLSPFSMHIFENLALQKSEGPIPRPFLRIRRRSTVHVRLVFTLLSYSTIHIRSTFGSLNREAFLDTVRLDASNLKGCKSIKLFMVQPDVYVLVTVIFFYWFAQIPDDILKHPLGAIHILSHVFDVERLEWLSMGVYIRPRKV